MLLEVTHQSLWSCESLQGFANFTHTTPNPYKLPMSFWHRDSVFFC